MQLLQIYHWTKFVKPSCLRTAAPLLFGAAGLVAGCHDLEHDDDVDIDDLELRDQDQAETGGSEADDGLDDPGIIHGHYIVMLKKGADPHAAAAAVQASPEHVFTSAISGFAGTLNAGQLQALAQHKDVVRIEHDRVVTAAEIACPTYKGTPPVQLKVEPELAPAYSVDRIDQRERPFDNSYTYAYSGAGVTVFIVDTWLKTDHPDFGGRASLGYDGYPNEPSNGEDCSGHATHVAGIVGGKKWGVAKSVGLVSVEVLDCTGHGSWSKLLAGIDWISKHKGDYDGKGVVANMSLSGRESGIVDSAVNGLADSGVFVAVAAGNENKNACNYSPAGADNAMTVAANNSRDERASFSNYGSCVDIYAGGTNVRSDWPVDPWDAPASGTSMASPHVAGVAALYKQAFNDTPWHQIKDYLETSGVENEIEKNVANTPNLLLYWPCSGSGK